MAIIDLYSDFITENEVKNKLNYRYEVSDNLAKVAKIQKKMIDISKELIDTSQLITEMSDELIALRNNYSDKIEEDKLKTLDNMSSNLKNTKDLLNQIEVILQTKEEEGKNVSAFEYISKLQKNLESLKLVYKPNV